MRIRGEVALIAGGLAALIVLPTVALAVDPGVFATPYWMAFVACTILAVIGRALAETWLHPAPVFAAAWAIFFAFPAFLVTSLVPAPTADAYIVLAVALATIPAAIVTSIRAGQAEPRVVRTARWVRLVVLLGGFTGIAAAMLAARGAGLAITTPFTITGLRRAGLAISVARYTGIGGQSPAEVLLMAVTYGSAILAPFAAAHATRRSYRLLLLVWPLVGAIVFSVATTARAGMIEAAVLTVSSVVMVRSLAGAGRGRIRFRTVLGTLAGVVVMAALFVFAAFSRVQSVTTESRLAITQKLGSYVGGSIPALDVWLGRHNLTDGLPWTQRFGAQTFAGLRGLNGGGGGRALLDFAQIETDSTTTTNVFTLFRSLITDYGIVGSLTFLLLASMLAAVTWRRAVLTGHTWPLIFTIGFMAAGLFSATSSLFVSTNTIVAFLGATLALRFGCRLPTEAVEQAAVREREERDAAEAARLAKSLVEQVRRRQRPSTKATRKTPRAWDDQPKHASLWDAVEPVRRSSRTASR